MPTIIINGAPMAKVSDVTKLERFSMNEVSAGSSAPMLSNMVLNFGTIKIRRPRLTLTARSKTNAG